MTSRRYYTLLLAIIAVGMLARLFHFTLSIGSDDQLWIITAQDLGKPYRPEIQPVFYSRIVWRAVLALWQVPAGTSLEMSKILMFALSVVTILTIAASAAMTFGRGAALLAAALYATHPLNIVYDVATLPDGLAMAILAAYLFLFLKYLRTKRLVYLFASAFLVGASYSAKDYYVLAALPFGLCLLCERGRGIRNVRNGLLFVVFLLLGLSVDGVLHFWESGNPLAHVAAVSDYGNKQALVAGIEATGIRRLHSLVLQRLRYFDWLFVDGGVIAGFILLWGTTYLACKSRACLTCRALFATAITFALFLVAMPVQLQPLLLVEMQARYLAILFPMLAIGGGAALSAAWTSFASPALRSSLVSVLVLGFLYSITVPNDQVDHHRVQEFVGIRQVLREAKDNPITELVLPADYELFLPSSYHAYGVCLKFRDVEDGEWVGDVCAYLENRPRRAVFLPERPYPPTNAYSNLKERLEASGFCVEEVRVPRTSYRAWLRRFDLIDANDQLVGWICRSGQPTQPSKPRTPPASVSAAR